MSGGNCVAAPLCTYGRLFVFLLVHVQVRVYASACVRRRQADSQGEQLGAAGGARRAQQAEGLGDPCPLPLLPLPLPLQLQQRSTSQRAQG